MRTFFLILLAFIGSTPIVSIASTAGQIVSESDLAFMPTYCRGTQNIRKVSKDPKPISEYIAQYGFTYTHLHHFCWGLNWERKAWLASNAYDRNWMLNRGVLDIDYVLVRAEPNFILLPELLNAQARMLFAMKRDQLAIIALQKAINAKPEYAPAYAQLSDHYVEKNDKTQAVSILKQGIEHTENAATLIKRLEKLGIAYQGIPGSAINKTASQVTIEPDMDKKTDVIPAPASTTANPTDKSFDAINQDNVSNVPASTTNPNPHCRFCP